MTHYTCRTHETKLNSIETGANKTVLNNTVTSTSTIQATTANAVKIVYDRAEQTFQSASNGKNLIANAITGKGGTVTSSDTFAQLASAMGNISTGKKWVSGTVLSSYTMRNFLTGAGQKNSRPYIQLNDLGFAPFTFFLDNKYGDVVVLFPEAFVNSSYMDTRILIVPNM